MPQLFFSFINENMFDVVLFVIFKRFGVIFCSTKVDDVFINN